MPKRNSEVCPTFFTCVWFLKIVSYFGRYVQMSRTLCKLVLVTVLKSGTSIIFTFLQVILMFQKSVACGILLSTKWWLKMNEYLKDWKDCLSFIYASLKRLTQIKILPEVLPDICLPPKWLS